MAMKNNMTLLRGLGLASSVACLSAVQPVDGARLSLAMNDPDAGCFTMSYMKRYADSLSELNQLGEGDQFTALLTKGNPAEVNGKRFSTLLNAISVSTESGRRPFGLLWRNGGGFSGSASLYELGRAFLPANDPNSLDPMSEQYRKYKPCNNSFDRTVSAGGKTLYQVLQEVNTKLVEYQAYTSREPVGPYFRAGELTGYRLDDRGIDGYFVGEVDLDSKVKQYHGCKILAVGNLDLSKEVVEQDRLVRKLTDVQEIGGPVLFSCPARDL